MIKGKGAFERKHRHTSVLTGFRTCQTLYMLHFGEEKMSSVPGACLGLVTRARTCVKSQRHPPREDASLLVAGFSTHIELWNELMRTTKVTLQACLALSCFIVLQMLPFLQIEGRTPHQQKHLNSLFPTMSFAALVWRPCLHCLRSVWK